MSSNVENFLGISIKRKYSSVCQRYNLLYFLKAFADTKIIVEYSWMKMYEAKTWKNA